mmetsp:Transcript_25322/g.52568  ORF Transcript_25322/g.52568 Transcript_25322/m.52568 type:complete len:209 (+) Transcript_25322:221-847(+)
MESLQGIFVAKRVPTQHDAVQTQKMEVTQGIDPARAEKCWPRLALHHLPAACQWHPPQAHPQAVMQSPGLECPLALGSQTGTLCTSPCQCQRSEPQSPLQASAASSLSVTRWRAIPGRSSVDVAVQLQRQSPPQRSLELERSHFSISAASRSARISSKTRWIASRGLCGAEPDPHPAREFETRPPAPSCPGSGWSSPSLQPIYPTSIV